MGLKPVPVPSCRNDLLKKSLKFSGFFLSVGRLLAPIFRIAPSGACVPSVPILFGLQNDSVGSVNLILVLIPAGLELHIVHLDAVLIVQLAFVAGDIPLGQTRVGQGGGFCRILPDRAAGGGGGSGGGLGGRRLPFLVGL